MNKYDNFPSELREHLSWVNVWNNSKIPTRDTGNFLKYFEEPTQVAFYNEDEDDSGWLGGVAYRDEVICGECGCVLKLDDLSQLVILNWTSISEAIIGDMNF